MGGKGTAYKHSLGQWQSQGWSGGCSALPPCSLPSAMLLSNLSVLGLSQPNPRADHLSALRIAFILK